MTNVMSRRGVLGSAIALGGLIVAEPTLALAQNVEKRLAFRNIHTNEKVDALFVRNGRLDAKGLAEINHGLRDWRTGDVHLMDTELMILLASLRDRLGRAPGAPFEIICGYRSPKTNAMLHNRGGAHSGVANQSQHMLGKASDIAVPGVRLDTLRMAAVSLGRGGVGYYPRDGFVHVDTARVRYW